MHKEILRIAIPNILTNISIPLVSLVDIFLVASLNQPKIIYATGLAISIFHFLYLIFSFFRMAMNGMSARLFGSKNEKGLTIILIRGVVFAGLIGIIIILFDEFIFYFANSFMIASPDTIKFAQDYFKIRVLAAPATICTYVFHGFFLGIQSNRIPMFIIIITSLVNLILSMSFTFLLDLGLPGIAWGTVISQYLCIVLYVIKIPPIAPIKSFLEIFKGYSEFISTNVFLFLRTACIIFVFTFFKFESGKFGDLVGASNILLLEFLGIIAFWIDGFAFASESIVGKYKGSQSKLLYKVIQVTFLWGTISSFLISLLFYKLGEPILYLMSSNEDLIQKSLEFFPWIILLALLASPAYLWDGIFVGIGWNRWMLMTMSCSTVIFFINYRFLYDLGNHGLWIAMLSFMVFRGAAQSIVWFGKGRSKINLHLF